MNETPFLLAFIAALTAEQAIGKLHLLLWYVPTVLFSGALIADLLYYSGRKMAFTIGHWLIILGVISCVPVLLTGIAAETGLDPNNYWVIKHHFLGYATAVAASFYAGLRISAMLWNLPLKPIHYAFLSLLLVALVFWTSDYGGLISNSS